MQILFLLFGFLLPVFAHAAEDSGAGEEGGGDSSSDSPGWLSTLWGYFDSLLEAIEKFIKWCTEVVLEVFKSLLVLLKDVVYWTVETLLKFAASLIEKVAESFNLDSLSSQLQGYWSMVPQEVQQIMQTIGVPTALGIVLLGILIRFTLQLIPFVRLGS